VIASGNIEIDGSAKELREKGIELEKTYLGEIS
jgi:hypothetical protein